VSTKREFLKQLVGAVVAPAVVPEIVVTPRSVGGHLPAALSAEQVHELWLKAMLAYEQEFDPFEILDEGGGVWLA